MFSIIYRNPTPPSCQSRVNHRVDLVMDSTCEKIAICSRYGGTSIFLLTAVRIGVQPQFKLWLGLREHPLAASSIKTGALQRQAGMDSQSPAQCMAADSIPPSMGAQTGRRNSRQEMH